VVLGPDESVSARCTEDCATLLVELERDALITHTRGLLNNSWAEPPRFRPIMRLDSDAANIWHDFLLFLLDKVDDVDHAEPALRQPLMAAELERALMTGLLIAQPNVHSAALTGKADAEPSSPAELASRMITDSPEAGHTVAGLAQAVGVSVRTLEKEFRRRFGIAPYTYLRQVRLARAHADLSELDSADKKVSEVAARWGFHHLGRFAREYRNKYDEYPSETAQHVRASKVR
jgi:AraC-like DNA-binding protein